MNAATIASRMWSIHNAGSKWIRVTIYWDNIEKSKGHFDWSQLDFIRDEAVRKGVEILPVLLGSPQWTFRKREYISDETDCLCPLKFNTSMCQCYPNGSYNYKAYQFLTPHKQDFVDFVKAVVSRYKNDFKYWEIWNEANWCINGNSADPKEGGPGRCWEPPEARVYGDIMKTIYPTIKDVDPDAKVILGGLSYNDLDFLHQYYVATAGFNTFDILALHPYIPGSPNDSIDCQVGYPWPGYSRYKDNYNYRNWSGIIDIRNEMYWAGDIGKPIWITEFGWEKVKETDRDIWLRETLESIGKDLGFVEKVFYHCWSDHPGYENPKECPSNSFGLLKLDSSCKEYVTSALDVYASWARQCQKVNIQFPAFNQTLNPNSWYKFTGAFNDFASFEPSQVRLVLDGNEITSYDVQFEKVGNNKKWYFQIQLRPWLKTFGTLKLVEHSVALKVDCGGTIGTFYTSQAFQVSNP